MNTLRPHGLLTSMVLSNGFMSVVSDDFSVATLFCGFSVGVLFRVCFSAEAVCCHGFFTTLLVSEGFASSALVTDGLSNGKMLCGGFSVATLLCHGLLTTVLLSDFFHIDPVAW